jgi:cholesterol transport system auxiliary component
MISRRSLRLIVPICAALTSVVAGCMSGRARQIYVLSDAVDAPPDKQAAMGRTELQLERVLVPDYLDTTDILLRVGEHELHASSSGRWGERLSLGIMHALWADLAIRLPQDGITLARPAERSARQILVNVDAFDVWPNGHCVLAANWSIILDTDRTVVLATGRGTFIVPPDRSGKPSDGAVVSAMGDALRQLAESIALSAS